MRSIAIRDFHHTCYTQLKSVPFIVTRQNHSTLERKPVFIVVAYDPNLQVIIDEFLNPPTVKVPQPEKPAQPEKSNIITRIFGRKK